MCMRQHLKHPCCGVRREECRIVKCEDPHLINEEGHLKEAEHDKVMEFKCYKCLHANLAKEREKNAAVHPAVEKSTTHGELGPEKRKSTMVHTA